MHAESSPFPDPETPPAFSTPNVSTPQATVTVTNAGPSRKRKRAPVTTASSPAPSDHTPGGANTTDLLATSRADLSSRPILTISRGPIFIPIAEGSQWNKTEMVGVNRVGYRYIPAGINPSGYASPCRTIESNPTSFRVSWEDRSSFLKVTKDGLGIAGSKGFRSARCNAPIREGKWYMEVKIMHGGGEHVGEESTKEGSHVRLGWARREAPLNAPAGLDGYSYGFRDKNGDKVTLSRPRPYGKPFGSGDVVGMYISLPPRRQANPKDPHDPANLKRVRIPIDLKGQEVFEILEYPTSKEMTTLMDYVGKPTNSGSLPSTSNKKGASGKLPERPPQPGTKPVNANLRPLPILEGSRIAFFINGECQGTAFQDLYDYLPLRQTETQRKANSKKRTREGVKEHRENPFDDGTLGYYPFISLFNDAVVQLNPGPSFDFPPPDDIDELLTKMDPDKSDVTPNGASIIPNTTTSLGDSVLQNPTDVEHTIPNLNDPTLSSEPTIVPPETDTLLQDAIDVDVKPQIIPTNSESEAPPLVQTSTSKCTWRPTVERYPEFMKEEWEFDATEEEEAKVEFSKMAEKDAEEEEKRKMKEKRKKQADARKKARKDAADKVAKNMKDEEEKERALERDRSTSVGLGINGVEGINVKKERYTSNSLSSYLPGHLSAHHHAHPSPSPLRHSTSAYDQEQDGEGEDEVGHDDLNQYYEGHDEHEPGSEAHSPATYASYGENQGGQSGYSTENGPDVEDDNEMDVDHELEAMIS